MDRQRVAQALAYDAERRRRLDLIPNRDEPTIPREQSLRSRLENLSIGAGQGLVNQLEGVKALVTDPVGTAKGAYEAVTGAIRDPAVIAQALREIGQKATSGPLGAGEVIGEMLGPMRGRPAPDMLELDVYHGTPHRFPATEANPLGEFDASKIGTGEGAQAYGHGVYLAEALSVAEDYKKTISQSMTAGAQRRLQNAGGDLDKAIADTEVRAAKYRQGGAKSYAEAAEEDLRGLRQFKEAGEWTSGSLYKADLPDEMIDRMLDWDKPLSEQPKAVQDAFKDIMQSELWDADTRKLIQTVGIDPNEIKGKKLYELLSVSDELAGRGELGKAASEELARRGVPGIKYLDAGSRGQGGSGTRNFVVFPGEEKKVRILERDGQKAPPQKIAQALEAAPDYRMTHRPMSDAGGASRLHNAYESFGEDIYGPKALQYFGAGDPREAKVVAALKRLRDNPNAEVTIYRGVPKDAANEIGKGDWVTLDRSVAAEYGDKVLTKKVKAKDITTWPDSLLEFGYYPEN